SPFPDRYIVNVSSAEGSFSRDNKTGRHPHTNMAKAALNMLTRTSAGLYANSGIHMNSVDPGWITHMIAVDPSSHAELSDFTPPLDAVDGAARIYDPVIRGIEGRPIHGLLLRNFQSVSW
ncbi:MAG TPA: SDR family oxidoreductase, partial [Phycisphaerae bacterium]|nr:SDR family oxidoreductase [Phycisphaerae bacterium]